jgi:putative membrane protein
LIFQENDMGIEWLRPGAFFGSILYALVGVAMFWVSFVIIDKVTPYNLWEEIIEKQNMALSVVVAAMALGISIIVAAAVHG